MTSMTYAQQAAYLTAMGWRLAQYANMKETLTGKVWFDPLDNETGYTLSDALALEAKREAIMEEALEKANDACMAEYGKGLGDMFDNLSEDDERALRSMCHKNVKTKVKEAA